MKIEDNILWEEYDPKDFISQRRIVRGTLNLSGSVAISKHFIDKPELYEDIVRQVKKQILSGILDEIYEDKRRELKDILYRIPAFIPHEEINKLMELVKYVKPS